MASLIQDFQIVIASVNGSGTLTANRILHKVLFREGYHVVGKNLFPSNIEGLPTYYFLRISKGFNSTKKLSEVYVALNPATVDRDLKTLITDQSLCFLNSDLKMPNIVHPYQQMSFKDTVKNSKASIKIKKRMSNMCYVGWLGRYLNLNLDTIKEVIHSHFLNQNVADQNIEVMQMGWDSCEVPGINLDPNLKTKPIDEILIEGNQASALGWVDGGCTVATWYPITPSTSLVESFETYAKKLRPDPSSVAIVQSEDEISAISSVVGAGWAGARSATATSGPGLSLMSEALGLSYFAEIPSVVCDVQRVGPSTGLPTRTSQGDLEFAYKISHGDTFHPVLLPADPKECFEMSSLAFDVADKYQTPVLVLSDLDIGMNLWTTKTLVQSNRVLDRSYILSEPELENLKSQGQKFKRYLGDEFGIPKRTIPGTHHPDAAYFTRGSGHNESAGYSEHPEDYEFLMNRLQTKVLSSRQDLPAPIIKMDSKNKMGVIYFGSSAQIFPELNQILNTNLKIELNTCQVRSLPLHESIYDFINQHDQVFVVEQNRDGQLRNIILQKPHQVQSLNPSNANSGLESNLNLNSKLVSITYFNGWSIQADVIADKILSFLWSLK